MILVVNDQSSSLENYIPLNKRSTMNTGLRSCREQLAYRDKQSAEKSIPTVRLTQKLTVRAALSTEPKKNPFWEMLDEEGNDISRLDPGFLFLNPKNVFYQSAGMCPLGLQIHNGDVSIDLSVSDPIELKRRHRCPSFLIR